MTKIAVVFPGQGSQSIGMMAGWDDHPAVRATFDEASDALGDVDVVDDRDRRRAELHLRESRREALGRRLQERAVERRRYRQQHPAFRAASLRGPDRALDGCAVAASATASM